MKVGQIILYDKIRPTFNIGDLTDMKLNEKRESHTTRRKEMVASQVVPDMTRCVQCGICSFYCPINIDVRRYAWRDQPIKDSHCLTCGECISRCPRAVLHFETSDLFGLK